MPTTPLKTLLYLGALPLLAPSVSGKLSLTESGHALCTVDKLKTILIKHHVQGGAVMLMHGDEQAAVHASLKGSPNHRSDDDTLYRVASLTKTATTLAVLRLCEQNRLTLDTPVATLLPEGDKEEKLKGMTVEMLLSHRSGLSDTPAYDRVLASGGTYRDVLADPNAVFAPPGEAFHYCNLGFGLIGCVMEAVTGLSVDKAMDQLLFAPLGMNAALSAATLLEENIMEITRVLQRHRRPGLKATALGKKPITAPDPARHFGYTAGAMYANLASVAAMYRLIACGGTANGVRFLSEESIRQMTTVRSDYGSISPGMHYGMGLVIFHDQKLPGKTLIGHQGFAYGCVDGAFFQAETGDLVVSLNGGASEARRGRMGRLNLDILRWAFGKELPQWM